MLGLLFHECGNLLQGSTGIFSKGHLSHAPFSYVTFRVCFFSTDMFNSIGTTWVDFTILFIDYIVAGSGSSVQYVWHFKTAVVI